MSDWKDVDEVLAPLYERDHPFLPSYKRRKYREKRKRKIAKKRRDRESRREAEKAVEVRCRRRGARAYEFEDGVQEFFMGLKDIALVLGVDPNLVSKWNRKLRPGPLRNGSTVAIPVAHLPMYVDALLYNRETRIRTRSQHSRRNLETARSRR